MYFRDTMVPWLKCVLCVVFAVTIHVYCVEIGPDFLEKEFINHIDENESSQKSVITSWSSDQQKALCERALNDSRQFSFNFQALIVGGKSVLFNHHSHEPVKLEVLQCPADNTFIYESRRQRDCYLIMSHKKFKNITPVGYLYIQYERCELGLMPANA